jgi:hypothetical protein
LVPFRGSKIAPPKIYKGNPRNINGPLANQHKQSRLVKLNIPNVAEKVNSLSTFSVHEQSAASQSPFDQSN